MAHKLMSTESFETFSSASAPRLQPYGRGYGSTELLMAETDRVELKGQIVIYVFQLWASAP